MEFMLVVRAESERTSGKSLGKEKDYGGTDGSWLGTLMILFQMKRNGVVS